MTIFAQNLARIKSEVANLEPVLLELVQHLDELSFEQRGVVVRLVSWRSHGAHLIDLAERRIAGKAPEATLGHGV